MNRNEDGSRKEFQVLEKLRSASIPVPKAYDIGRDILGFGFIIMEKVRVQNMNRVFNNMLEAKQAELWRQFSETLAHIHIYIR